MMAAYVLLAKKTYRRNRQYRASHMVNNVASAIFGFIYIAIWQSAAANGGVGDYTSQTFTYYVAFNQAMLWVTIFHTFGLGIPETVRTGAVSLEMMRPTDFHLYVLSREAGSLWYNLWHRTLPLAAVFALTVGFHMPSRASTYPTLLCAVFLATYIGLCLHYLSGLSSFWTLQSSWAHQILFTAHFGLSGFLVPVDLLPGPLASAASFLPLATLQYYPARIYLELSGVEALLPGAIWAVLLTCACRLATKRARRTLEVQGG